MTLLNLAGVKCADTAIIRELYQAGIGIVPLDNVSKYEVNASCYGVLSGWQFTRAW